MSAASRALKVGDEATTSYKRGITLVKILRRLECKSQSGVVFQVRPPLDRYRPLAWYDADWFEPVPANLL